MPSHKTKTEAELAEFAAGFTRASTGTLWRKYDGRIVSVFFRRGSYHWCIANDNDLKFSREKYATQDAAMIYLAKELLAIS